MSLPLLTQVNQLTIKYIKKASKAVIVAYLQELGVPVSTSQTRQELDAKLEELLAAANNAPTQPPANANGAAPIETSANVMSVEANEKRRAEGQDEAKIAKQPRKTTDAIDVVQFESSNQSSLEREVAKVKNSLMHMREREVIMQNMRKKYPSFDSTSISKAEVDRITDSVRNWAALKFWIVPGTEEAVWIEDGLIQAEETYFIAQAKDILGDQASKILPFLRGGESSMKSFMEAIRMAEKSIKITERLKQKTKEKVCFRCQQTGHLAKDCKQASNRSPRDSKAEQKP
jgi:hypothetical protein